MRKNAERFERSLIRRGDDVDAVVGTIVADVQFDPQAAAVGDQQHVAEYVGVGLLRLGVAMDRNADATIAVVMERRGRAAHAAEGGLRRERRQAAGPPEDRPRVVAEQRLRLRAEGDKSNGKDN